MFGKILCADSTSSLVATKRRQGQSFITIAVPSSVNKQATIKIQNIEKIGHFSSSTLWDYSSISEQL